MMSLSAAAPEPVADLGRVLYVGDSITHGKSSGSWRWELFKIFVDNGVRLQEVGVQTGNYNGRGGVAPGTLYRGFTFANRHAAQYSEKAAEVAGRESEPSRMGGTGIRHWLRLEDKAGTEWQLADNETPDTFFFALGTNDFVAEHSSEAGGLAAAQKKVQFRLLGKRRGKAWSGTGDLDAIVSAAREANPRARLVVIGMPVYGDAVGKWCHKAITDKDYEAVREYNKALSQWGEANKLTVVDMNAGFRDVQKPGAAVSTMLVDQMHPNAQGNLIYAGNVAKALGYAGRTAGLARKAATAFPHLPEPVESRGVSADKVGCLSLSVGGSLALPGSEGQGATVELDFRNKGLGNGARGKWKGERKPLQVELTVARGVCGQLQLRESGLCWGGKLLYSTDMSKLTEPVRLVWTPGRPGEGVAGGFYVWLGDMLIGEALKGEASSRATGLTVEAGELAAPNLKLAYDSSSAWAPPTKRFTVAPCQPAEP